MSFLKLTLFLSDGDVESNPVRQLFKIQKSVTGSYNQGDIRSGATAGRQCVFNAFYSIAWSIYRRVSLWTAMELDNFLIKGDKIYKSLDTNQCVTLENLPSFLHVDNKKFNILKLEYHQGVLLRLDNSRSFNLIYENETMSIT